MSKIVQQSKNVKNSQKISKFCKYFLSPEVFLVLFSKTISCKELGFLALHLVHQDVFFELSNTAFEQFFIFFIIRGDPCDFFLGWGDQRVTRHGKKGLKKVPNSFVKSG